MSRWLLGLGAFSLLLSVALAWQVQGWRYERQLAQQAQGHHGILIKQLMTLGTQAGDGNRSLASLDERTEQVVQQWHAATAQLQESVDTIAGSVDGLADKIETLNLRDPA